MKKVYLPLILLILAVPVGLISQNPAWGEWEEDFFKKTVGYIPAGIKNAVHVITPLMPDYSLPGLNPVFSYYLSAIFGVLLIFVTFHLLYRVSKK
jgi:cobalt/nickel transport protein